LVFDPPSISPGEKTNVRFRVRNTGSRDGDEVVQLYLRDVLASVARPVIELKAFRRVSLRIGEEKEIEFVLGPAELEMLDANLRRVVEPGEFKVMIGASSADIRLSGSLLVRPR
jgi:beta-glucosidase